MTSKLLAWKKYKVEWVHCSILEKSDPFCLSATLTTMPKTGHICQLDNPDKYL